MSEIVGYALVVLSISGAAAALHLSVLSVSSIFFRERVGTGHGTRFLVIVPAHNEEAVIRETLQALSSGIRAADTILVVADRCTDQTAEVARSHGVNVLERGAGERPGRAAAVEAGLEFGRDREWDAAVTIDADTVVDAGFFEALDAAYGPGVEAVQPRSEHTHRSGLAALISEAAFAFQVSQWRGRERLGLSVRLRGSGMSVSRRLATTRSFSTSGASEDLFYSLDLLLDGYSIRHVESARLRSLPPHNFSTISSQRLRFETGRAAAARRYALPLIKRRTPSSIEAAIFLLTPPFGVAVFLLAAGAVGGWLVGSGWIVALSLALIVALAVDVAIALVAARSRWDVWAALAVAPAYVVWKTWIQAKAFLNLRRAHEPYEPTPRE